MIGKKVLDNGFIPRVNFSKVFSSKVFPRNGLFKPGTFSPFLVYFSPEGRKRQET
jgi:hypothetical protein